MDDVEAVALPCPFCGGEAVMRQDDDPGYPYYVTFNHNRDCVMYAVPTDFFRSFSTEAEAITAWNTRAALPSREGWRDIASAPAACHVLATRFDADAGEWVVAVVASPPIQPFTHWQPLPAPPGQHREAGEP